MSERTSITDLRLVGADGTETEAQRGVLRRATEVADANRSAALDAGDAAIGENSSDPRWVLAAQTYAQLQGTVLPPERRDKLMRLGSILGLRTFDTNVIIAVVQDTARRHEPLGEARALLQMVPAPRSARQRSAAWPRWIAAIACATIGTAWIIRWFILG